MTLLMGLAGSVARLGLDADEHRGVSRLGVLQGGRELVAVSRHHPVVVVGGGDERGRIAGAGSKIVKRGIGQQRLELLGILRGAVVRNPGPSNGEFLETQHVQHPDCRQGRTEQFRPLSHDGSHQQPSVTAPADGQLGGTGVSVPDQPFGCGNEVIENVLLVLLGPSLVPLFSVLASSPQVGDRQQPPISIQTRLETEKRGVREMLNPP